MRLFKDCAVKSATTEVEHQHDFGLVNLLKVTGHGCRGRLVDEAKDIEAGNSCSVMSRLLLGVREVCRDGDDGFGDGASDALLCNLLRVPQDLGRDLFGLDIAVHILERLDNTTVFAALGQRVREAALNALVLPDLCVRLANDTLDIIEEIGMVAGGASDDNVLAVITVGNP